MNSQLRIIVTGLIAQYPLGGVTWDYLQYVLGLSRMGHDVYYLEDTGFWPYNPVSGGLSDDGCDYNVDYLSNIMSQYGLQDRWMYRLDSTDSWYGLNESKRRALLDTADVLINVSGCLAEPAKYRSIDRMIYIDSDPVFTQIKLNSGFDTFRDQIDQHDVLFTFAENRNHKMPDTGDLWHCTRQPVVLSEWEPVVTQRDVFTTIMNWTSYQSLAYKGENYGQKDVEFEHFIALPDSLPSGTLEIAVNEGKTDHTPYERLVERGWNLVSPNEVCGDLKSYRDYIQHSLAEWSVAKNGYVKGESGWFSCRSACYLASARPVVVQDTGFSSLLEDNFGVVAFNTPEEALAGIESVRSDYQHHSDAARAIAESRFDAAQVLQQLLETAYSNTEVATVNLYGKIA